jgi:hypothetical protein
MQKNENKKAALILLVPRPEEPERGDVARWEKMLNL